MAGRAGFGDNPNARGLDVTQGYRDRNPYLDKDFVLENIAPYKDAGLGQKISDFRGKSDMALYDAAAAAVIKFNKLKPKPEPDPAPPKPPKPPPVPVPDKTKKPPKPPKKPPKVPKGGTTPPKKKKKSPIVIRPPGTGRGPTEF